MNFINFSLLIFDEKQNLKAILPANRVGETLFSHQGLTYGALVLNQKTKLQEVIEMVATLLLFLEENEILKWRYFAVGVSRGVQHLWLIGAFLV